MTAINKSNRFPVALQATGPLSAAYENGVWQVGFDASGLQEFSDGPQGFLSYDAVSDTLSRVGFAPEAMAVAGTDTERPLNSAGVAAAIDARVGERYPFVILAMGQSNQRREQAYSWTPPSNLQVWDWDGTETDVGSAFVACPTTTISAAWAFAAEFALANPLADVRVVKIAFGGRPIENWLGGFRSTWRSDTSSSAPASGETKFNNASPASVTAIYFSNADTRGVFHGVDGVNRLEVGKKLRVTGPTGVATYTITNADTVGASGYKVPAVTYVSHTGTFADGDAVRVLHDQDAYPATKANIEAALAVLGVSAIDMLHFWQCESNAGDPRGWIEDRTDLDDTMLAETWFPRSVLTICCGMTTNDATGTYVFGQMNNYVAYFASLDRSRRVYVSRYGIPPDLWEDGGIHGSAEAYAILGKTDFAAVFGGGGVPLAPGMTVDQDYGYTGINAPRAYYPLDIKSRSDVEPPQGVVASFENGVAGSAAGAMVRVGTPGVNSYAFGVAPTTAAFVLDRSTSWAGAGTNVLAVTTQGHLGVGQQYPNTRLYIEHSGATDGVIATFREGTAGGAGARLLLNAAGYGSWWAGMPAANAYDIRPAGSSSSSLYITSTGKVGVNYTASDTQLYVAADNPTRGIIHTDRNTNSSGSTGALLLLSAAGVGHMAIGVPPSGQACSIYLGRTTAADGTLAATFSATALNPGSDNTFTLGSSGARWASVWSATGTIQTSDAAAKSDIADCALGLEFIRALRPVSYRYTIGGVEQVEEEAVERIVEPATEKRTVERRVRTVVDGAAVETVIVEEIEEPIIDEFPVVDESGAPVMEVESPAVEAVFDEAGRLVSPAAPEKLRQAVLRQPRMVEVDRVVKRTREIGKPGRRTHYGLIAQEVKAALDAAGVTDFAGYVLADPSNPASDSGLRYDSFLAPLIAAVQELAARVEALEAGR